MTQVRASQLVNTFWMTGIAGEKDASPIEVEAPAASRVLHR